MPDDAFHSVRKGDLHLRATRTEDQGDGRTDRESRRRVPVIMHERGCNIATPVFIREIERRAVSRIVKIYGGGR